MPRPSLPITTVRLDEQVRIDLKPRRSGVYAYVGVVTDVDARAIRLRDVIRVASYGGELPHSTRVAGDVAVAWTAIQAVKMVQEATG